MRPERTGTMNKGKWGQATFFNKKVACPHFPNRQAGLSYGKAGGCFVALVFVFTSGTCSPRPYAKRYPLTFC
ncbi:MAG: hypothetical protein DRH33_08765 [Candidatus Nealsonbacteria bacterium]|nr:MAG: hypothetical protein DRH33_08765 [Candidatus Nealsonbacteria bacterium]